MSAEKANRKRRVEGEFMASHEEELLEEKTRDVESGRKRRRITLDGEQQDVSNEDGGAKDVDNGGGGEEKEEHEGNERTVGITDLPPALLGYALQYLTFMETRFFFCGNSDLWQRRIKYDSRMMTDLVLPARPPQTFLCNFINVCHLDLGPWCSNLVLEYMCDEEVLPNLEHLCLACSIDVTDEGLALLPTNPKRCLKLKSLDIRFCHRLSFERTLDIRKLLKGLQLVRRQPPWLDGMHYYVDDKGCLEKCEHWADGTISILHEDGSMAKCSYMRDLYEDGSEDCVVTKTQEVFNSDPEMLEMYEELMDEWEYHAYRPGIRYLRISDGHILEAYRVNGLYPPMIIHELNMQTLCSWGKKSVMMNEVTNAMKVIEKHTLVWSDIVNNQWSHSCHHQKS